MRNQFTNLSEAQHVGSTRNEGFWSRLGQFLRRSSPPAASAEPEYVKVWDAYRDTYRRVDLSDRNDPLWHAAHNIAMMQSHSSTAPRSAA